MLHFTNGLYIARHDRISDMSNSNYKTTLHSDSWEASKTFSCYENLHSLTRSPSGQSQSLLSQPRDGEYPGNGQICIPRVLTVTVSFLEKELRAIYCHIKQDEDKLSAASQMATTITAPSFPAPAGMHRSIAGQGRPLEITTWSGIIEAAATRLGCVGPLAALAASSPRAAATVVVSWDASHPVCHPLLAHPPHLLSDTVIHLQHQHLRQLQLAKHDLAPQRQSPAFNKPPTSPFF